MNTIPGFMWIKELETLRYILSQYNYQDSIGVEIGSFLGRSSYEIAQTINKGKLYCIDSWWKWKVEETYTKEQIDVHNFPIKGTVCSLENFLNNTSECKNIITIKGNSPGIVKNWELPIDFLFLDGLHENPNDWENIEFWLPKIKSGGILSGHDYLLTYCKFPDVIENVNRLEKLLNQKVKNPEGTSIWYFNL
jgi:hypothetical protein